MDQTNRNGEKRKRKQGKRNSLKQPKPTTLIEELTQMEK